MANTTVLVVDDEAKISSLVKLYLERDGYRVVTAADGGAALAAFRKEEPDLIVLDLMLPGVGGLDVCKSIRAESTVPIIMLTARAEEADKLIGLELGADDYVTKPFSPRELAARVKTVLRRSNGRHEPASERVAAGGLRIDASRHEVSCRGRPVELTPTEFRLLWALARQPGRVFSRSQLMNEALEEYFEGYERTVDAHVKNLRHKLAEAGGPGCIDTVYGVGYRFTGAGDA